MHCSICRIPLDAVLEEGSLPETAYNIVKDQKFCGEIKVALTFTAEVKNAIESVFL
jgi:hypothetical protein